MAKQGKEGRRGQGARAHRKRVQSPEARAAARELGLRLHAAYLVWREANPGGLKEAARRAAETRRENREAEGVEKMVILHVLVRPDQREFLKARAASCPCSLGDMVRHCIDAQIYCADSEEEA